MFKITAQGDRLYVTELPKIEKTKGGIIIPDAAQERTMLGKVVFAGNDAYQSSPGYEEPGQARYPKHFEPGQIVHYSKYAGLEVTLNGEAFRVISSKDVLAVLEETIDISGDPAVVGD